MIDEEEKKRYCEATKCEDCVGWHKYCNAECCKLIKINMNPKELEKPGKWLMVAPGVMTGPDIRYYALRDVQYLRMKWLRFDKSRCEAIGGNIWYFHPCSRLNGNLCLDHPDKKPEFCKVLTLETSKIPNAPFAITENCLFKYKSKEVKKDE